MEAVYNPVGIRRLKSLYRCNELRVCNFNPRIGYIASNLGDEQILQLIPVGSGCCSRDKAPLTTMRVTGRLFIAARRFERNGGFVYRSAVPPELCAHEVNCFTVVLGAKMISQTNRQYGLSRGKRTV